MGQDVACLVEDVLMKKILIVKTGMGFGGIERSLIEFLRGLDHSRYQIDLLLLYGPFDLLSEIDPAVNVINAEERSGKIRLHPVYMILYAISIFFHFCGMKKTFRKFKKRKQDFYYRKLYQKYCHCHYDAALAYQQTFACEYICLFVEADRKIMMYHHGEVENQEYLTTWFRKTDILITVGNGIKTKLEQAFSFLKGKIVVIRNYIEPGIVLNKAEEFIPETEQNRLNICTCGRISTEKGFDLAVDAANILRKKKIPFHWYFVGGGYPEQKQMIHQKLSDNGLEKFITITGFVNNPYPYLKHCDIFVVPSRFEANPLVIYEGKILQKIIISTRTDGAKELLDHGKNAWLCDVSAQSIAEAIIRIKDDPQLQRAFLSELQQSSATEQKHAFYETWDLILNNCSKAD